MNLRPNLLGLAKILILMFVLYTAWYRYAYGIQQILLYAPPILLTAIIFLHMVTHGNLNVKGCPGILVAFFVLAIYAFFIGNVIAVRRSYCLSTVATFFAHSLICFAVYYISREEKSVNWIMNILILCGVICSAYSYLRGFSYNTSGVDAVTLGEESNPNFLGLVMITSIFALIFDFDKFRKRIILNTVLLTAFSVTIILTASRENFVALIFVLFTWMFAFMNALAKESPSGGKTFHNSIYQIFVLTGITIGIVYFINHFAGTGLYTKIINALSKGEGITSRAKLYKEAWILFKRHYPVGVGFDQFRFYSSFGIYSHSTYAEIAACLGVFGLSIFFIPVFWTYFKIAHSYFKNRDYTNSILFIMFTAELILSFGLIVVYEFYQMIALTLISFVWSNKQQLK